MSITFRNNYILLNQNEASLEEEKEENFDSLRESYILKLEKYSKLSVQNLSQKELMFHEAALTELCNSAQSISENSDRAFEKLAKEFKIFHQRFEFALRKKESEGEKKKTSIESIKDLIDKLPPKLECKLDLERVLKKFYLSELDPINFFDIQSIDHLKPILLEAKKQTTSTSEKMALEQMERFMNLIQLNFISAYIKRAEALDQFRSLFDQYLNNGDFSPQARRKILKAYARIEFILKNPFDTPIGLKEMDKIFNYLNSESTLPETFQKIKKATEKLGNYMGFPSPSIRDKDVLFEAQMEYLLELRQEHLNVNQKRPKVVIEGSGVAGLFHGIAAFLMGGDVEIIEKREKQDWKDTYTRDQNLIALDKQFVGGLYEFLRIKEHMPEMVEYENGGYEYIAHSIAELQRCLRHLIEELKKRSMGGISVHEGEVIGVGNDDHTKKVGVLVKKDKDHAQFIPADVIIAAGGTKSTIKNGLGISMTQYTTSMPVLLVEFKQKSILHPSSIAKNLYHYGSKLLGLKEEKTFLQAPITPIGMLGNVRMLKKSWYGFLPIKTKYENIVRELAKRSQKGDESAKAELEKIAYESASLSGVWNKVMTFSTVFETGVTLSEKNIEEYQGVLFFLCGDSGGTAAPEAGAGARKAIDAVRSFAQVFSYYCQGILSLENTMSTYEFSMEQVHRRMIDDSFESRSFFRENSITPDYYLKKLSKEVAEDVKMNLTWMMKKISLEILEPEDLNLAKKLIDSLRPMIPNDWNDHAQRNQIRLWAKSDYENILAVEFFIKTLTHCIIEKSPKRIKKREETPLKQKKAEILYRAQLLGFISKEMAHDLEEGKKPLEPEKILDVFRRLQPYDLGFIGKDEFGFSMAMESIKIDFFRN